MHKLLIIIALVVTGSAQAAIIVTEPGSGTVRVAAGEDFAASEIGDAWDMAEASDVIASESLQISQEQIQGGVYSGVASGNDPQFYLLFHGVGSAFLGLYKGHQYPIDPQKYRYLTARVRYTNASGSPLNSTQPLLIYFYRDQTSIPDGTFGCSAFTQVQPQEWQIVTVDLWNSSCGRPLDWQDFSAVRGLRIDPTGGNDAVGVRFEFDWIRLTEPAGPAQQTTVRWSGGSAPYRIEAVSEDGVVATLATGVSGTSASVSLAKLAPGDWRIRVSGGGDSADSQGAVAVNMPPQFNFLQPDRRGDEANSYSAGVTGNSWGPIDVGDVEQTRNISGVSYTSPSGSLSGTSDPAPGITGDPYIIFNVTDAIDTERYRLVCYTMEVSGARDIGTGSVARVLYGNDRTALSTGDDIVVEEGLNEYCLGDIRTLELEGGQPHEWYGALRFIRLDPHEFPTSRDIRVDEFLLAPFDTANPGFGFTWIDADTDDNAVIDLFIDPDKNPNNGNETSITAGISENSAANSYSWTVPDGTPQGLYEVLARVSDGRNEIARYATAPLQVGAPGSVALQVTEPNGVDDVVPPSPEFSRDERRDAWDMSSSADVARTGGLASVTYQNGRFSGTSNTADPQLILLDPATNTSLMDTSAFRYLTVKLRITGPGTHFMNAFWFSDPATFGFTSGIVVDNGEWRILTLDLNQAAGSSSLDWTDRPFMSGLRLDPTGRSNAVVEIDWITLSGAAQPAEYTVRWSPDSLPNSDYTVFVGDADAEIEIAADLPSATRAVVADLSKLPVGSYNARVVADPGPTAISAGSLTLGGDLIFGSGFD